MSDMNHLLTLNVLAFHFSGAVNHQLSPACGTNSEIIFTRRNERCCRLYALWTAGENKENSLIFVTSPFNLFSELFSELRGNSICILLIFLHVAFMVVAFILLLKKNLNSVYWLPFPISCEISVSQERGDISIIKAFRARNTIISGSS